MSSDSPPSNGHVQANDVPPVIPPSGRHIIQLFVVPGIIVFGIILIFWVFSQWVYPWFFGAPSTPAGFLTNLERTNPDVRWRAANDLAQTLKRDDDLASDVQFGLKINELLARALDDLEAAERSLAENAQNRPARDQEKERRDFQAKRTYALFLCACLGEMSTPVGVPLLTDLAERGRGRDDKSNILIRRRAVWALANLGDNIAKRYQRLPQARRDGVLAHLRKETTGEGDRARWAAYTLDAMEGRRPVGVVPALATAAGSKDHFLRNLSAVALTFWEGSTPEEQALADKTLVALSRDNGWGERIEVKEND